MAKTSPTQTPEEMAAQIARLEADNQRLTSVAARANPLLNITFKVADKGGVSVYGLNARWPVTLYADQWERLLDKKEDLLAFINVNTAALKFKEAPARFQADT